MKRLGDAGAVLLEVLVALTILSVGGTAAVLATAESARAVAHARERDRELRAAGAFMEVVALWPREDLDRRLGDRRQGPWVLRVDRPDRRLYVVELRDSAGTALLRTSLFRPDTTGSHVAF